ncbi:MAG: ROK family protein [Microbacterium aurantiacum]|uniref:ROK family protein n=1 Tax=Microbacterium aurantiacum TaxID=162393 RepID=UPI004036995C
MLAALGRTQKDVAGIGIGIGIGIGFGIGIGVPCPVDSATGKPSWPPFMPAWDDFDIPARVRSHFDCAVAVDNDANVMAIGERATVWPDVSDLIFVKVANGIGAGIISEASVIRGTRGIAGNIGHVQVPREAGRLCRCGNPSCLTAAASGEALVEVLAARGLPTASVDDVARLVLNGNAEAIAAVRQVGSNIGEALAAGISFLNPKVIVIDSSLLSPGEHLLAAIRSAVYAKSMPIASEALSIVETQMGGQAGVVGAAIYAAQQVFTPEGMQRLLRATENPAH